MVVVVVTRAAVRGQVVRNNNGISGCATTFVSSGLSIVRPSKNRLSIFGLAAATAAVLLIHATHLADRFVAPVS